MVSLIAARTNQISSRARTGDLAFPASRPSGPSRGFFRRKDGRSAARCAASRRPTPLAATNMEFAYKSGISICGLGAGGAPGRFVRSRDTEMKRSLPFPPWPSPLSPTSPPPPGDSYLPRAPHGNTNLQILLITRDGIERAHPSRVRIEGATGERLGGRAGEGCTPGEINLPAVCRCGWSFSACLSLTPARVVPPPPRPLSHSLSLSFSLSLSHSAPFLFTFFFGAMRRSARACEFNSPGYTRVHAGNLLRLGPISRVVRCLPSGVDAGVSTIGLHIHPTRCTGSAVAR